MSQERTLRFETYGVENGLPNEEILDILEDSFGFIWIATIDGLVKFDGYDFKEYKHVPGDGTSLPSSIVHQLMEDSKGNIWVVTEGELSLYHRETDNFELLLSSGDLGPSGNAVQVVFEDKNHTIWVGTDYGLFRFNQQDCSLLPVASPAGVVENINIRCIGQDSKGRIWVGGYHGLQKLDTYKNSLEAGFFYSKNLSTSTRIQYIKDIEEDNNGHLWLATSAGAIIWDPDEKRLLPVPLPDSLANQGVYDILIDRNQNIWLAFQYKGLAFIDHKNYQTRLFQHSPYIANGLANDELYSLMQDRADNLWIGTTLGCQKINLSSVKFPVHQVRPGMEANENLIQRIHQGNKGGIWTTATSGQLFYAPALGLKPRQLYCNEPSALNFIYYYSGSGNTVLGIHEKTGVHAFNELNGTWQKMDLGDTINFKPNKVLFEDVHDPGILWIGNAMGLCKLNRHTNRRQWFNPKEDIPSVTPFIYNMLQLPDGNILVNAGEFSTGTLALFDQVSKRFKPLIFSKDDPARRAILSVRSFALTKKYGVWMATPSGLANYNVETGKCRILTSQDGLPTTSVMSVLSDEKDNIWVAFDGYLSKYMPSKDSIVSFDVRAEMPGFYSGSCSKGPDGRLFFGGSSGFMAFYPDSVFFDKTPPRVVLTGFKVLNRPRHFGTSPELIRNITLSHRDNVFSFHFASLNFIDPKNIRYKYKLEGFNEEWIDAGAERSATYTNLDADSYTFRVIASNSDGVWSKEGLAIQLIITPPVWATWWAKALYVLAALCLLYGMRRYDLNRRLANAKAHHLQELDAVKTRLYTNITHEFRTPLTIMLGLAEQLEAQVGETAKKGLRSIQRNGKELLHLINQMLSLAKLESGSLPVHMIQGDVVLFMKYLVESFDSLALSRKVRLSFVSDSEELYMDYDPEKLQMMVSNLISNAIKFNKEQGEVSVTLTNKPPEKIILSVRDSGFGIPEDKIPLVFDRFYQGDDSATRQTEGTGIGLALTKELVALFKGTIEVESQVGTGLPGEQTGSTFTVTLPVSRQAALQTTMPMVSALVSGKAAVAEVPEPAWAPSGLPRLLIIEDNADLVGYLSQLLRAEYQIFTAKDGKAGLKKVYETMPDVILCDVMMPEMDGFQVCHTLKKDLLTCHIPIVMLTAKADVASKLQGMEYGADAYIPKPFEQKVLKVRLRKLLDQRRMLQEHYNSVGFLSREKAETPLGIGSKRDSELLNKLIHFVEEHLDDPELNINVLSKQLGLSRSSLFRKVKALTDKPATDFIRDIRLTRAAQFILEKPDLNISEIAHIAGFNSLSHFSNRFKVMYGCSPNAYRSKREVEK